MQLFISAGIMHLGAVVAGLLTGPIMEKIGRKRTLCLVASGGFMLGNLLIALAPYVAFLMAGRFFVGFAVGVQLSCVTVYILEIATTDMKGVLGCFVQGMAAVGIVYTFGMSFALDWKFLAVASGVWCVPYTMAMAFVPETPRWLLKKGRQYSAMRSLEWLRGKQNRDAIEKELEAIRRDIERAKRQRFSLAVLADYWRPFLISLCLMFLLNVSGFNVLVFYPTNLFLMLETTINPNLATLIIGVELLISGAIAVVCVAKLSRRLLLVFSVLGMAVCQVLLAFSCYQIELFREEQKANFNENATLRDYDVELESARRDDLSLRPAYLDWLPVVAVCGYVFVGNMGFGTLVWIVSTELLPPKIRGLANSIVMCIFFTCGFLVAKTFVDLLQAVNLSGTILIYAGFCALGVLYTYFFVPETKDKPDEEIQRAANRGFFRCILDGFKCKS